MQENMSEIVIFCLKGVLQHYSKRVTFIRYFKHPKAEYLVVGASKNLGD